MNKSKSATFRSRHKLQIRRATIPNPKSLTFSTPMRAPFSTRARKKRQSRGRKKLFQLQKTRKKRFWTRHSKPTKQDNFLPNNSGEFGPARLALIRQARRV